MGIALAIGAAWLALAIAWARLRRSRAGPSSSAAELVAALRRSPIDLRAQLVAAAPDSTWEGQLGRDVVAASSADDRASAIDASLAELQVAFETSRAWDRVVPRVAILGGLLAASISVIRGGLVHALVAAAVGAVAAAVGVVLTRAAGATEARQRSRADELAQLLAGGRIPTATYTERTARNGEKGLGLDRRRGRR